MTTTITRTCQLCVGAVPATWDAPTVTGQWAYLCDQHYVESGSPRIGTNLADLERRQSVDADERHEALMAALDRGDFDAALDAVGDGDILDIL